MRHFLLEAKFDKRSQSFSFEPRMIRINYILLKGLPECTD